MYLCKIQARLREREMQAKMEEGERRAREGTEMNFICILVRKLYLYICIYIKTSERERGERQARLGEGGKRQTGREINFIYILIK